MINQPHLTQFFSSRHSWQVPWQRIQLCPGGWYLRACRIYCHGARASTLWCGNRYEIHYVAGLESEPNWEAIVAHELTHVLQVERLGWLRMGLGYAREMLKPYAENRFEREARNIEKEFYEWSNTQ